MRLRLPRILRPAPLLILPALAFLAARSACAQPPLPALREPARSQPAPSRQPQRARWSWNRAQAQVTPTGDLTWTPEPFRFQAGRSVRYIDYESGRDDNDGATKQTPWKHHPWDPAATGQARACTGIQTYVFRRGVVYRGRLLGRESGAPGDPIRLTSDPAWGQGEAELTGAERVTGWKRGADRADMPEADKIWYADLPFAPRNVWERGGSGITRIALARTPNWKESDPEEVRSEWWTWEQPEWWTNKNRVDYQGHRAHLGIDTKHLTRSADYYVGAVVRTEYGIVMGTPFPTRVEGYDPAKKGILFQGIWFGDSEQIITNCHYYLEDKPQYLDSPGEFWFEPKGEGGRLYLRLPDDRDPNTTDVEAGRWINLIESPGMSHLAITGLTFRFTNTHWDLTLAGWGHPDVANAALRIRGAAEDVRVANCRFEHIAGRAILIAPEPAGKPVDRIAICDNEIRYTDHGAMQVSVHGPGDVQILRNRLSMIGGRPYRQDHGHAVIVEFPSTMEVAGNILDRCYGAGLFLFGAKGSGEQRDVPLSRVLVHHNRAVATLLAANDWGGIETWQGGPHYVYDNISGDPNGRWWAYDPKKPGSARLGLAYYHDGAFKVYNFNNVAWGNPVEATSPLRCYAAYYEAVPTIENSFFNNTAYAFHIGSNWSPAGGRHAILGSLWMDISGMVFQHGQLKEDKEPAPAAYPHDTVALSRNVFSAISAPTFGVFEASGKGYAAMDAMRQALQACRPLAGDIGVMSPTLPVRDAKNHDFRPRPGSAAIDAGVRVFVPWALARTVGEWHFRRDNADPALLPDSHWYMAPYYTNREQYHNAPTFPLEAVHVTAADYTDGPLEDWTSGALKLNGKDQYARLSTARMTRPYTYSARGNTTRTVQGKELATPDMDRQNLLIEVYFRTSPGHTGGALVAKMAEAGYLLAVNRAGGVTLMLRGGGATAQLACGARINDGRWHHVVAEVDRAAGKGAIYVDGMQAAAGTLPLPPNASLSNMADLLVGRGLQGGYFAGALEYLRIARSTLAESGTSLEELYDWEFDGPFLRDFAGREPTGRRRDAGAFEAP